jgi:hypothetical protein
MFNGGNAFSLYMALNNVNFSHPAAAQAQVKQVLLDHGAFDLRGLRKGPGQEW